ncbi:Putative multicopper oxidase, type 1, multicopper oxidase, copper-binding, cupredoxin [Septoria linicola]|uniref:Multicopper oxidase, type 1, multicopper oxidase, copper-binding, cupredoxin n=1 Tax=Septoria linicola TaxID=215465 RepID=A0A9Q9B2C9_9PEZI|nr:putative multicopper oxidase, type 1, multicopper oxidase, copper-binding, cupredoxin [Septoria linicola]USW55971.1 Putative multicopper oxidase, type 1, multicopper oxidase, copper-binding, cupredoxin [Septoria linicola]
MRGLVASAASLLAVVSNVAAWGNRGGANGPPGHYGAPREHGSDFQPDHILRVTTANITVACQERESVLINGTSPGPPLRLIPGKRQWVRVYNDMCEEKVNTTIHWHGLSQRLAPFSDGTPQASQWPIPPCHYFDYEVFPLKKESGTYFYHSHVGFQAVSAAGPLIIEDCEEPPYKYDEERIVMLSDYFNHTDHHIEKGLLASPFVWSNETNAVLINGVGVAQEEAARSGTEGCELPVIDVEPGKTYRFRFIGSVAISMVQFGIDQHDNFTIIEADGHYTKPHMEDHMQLTSGQRFDTIFTAKTEEELNGKRDYVIQLQTKERPKTYIGYGVVRYKGGEPEITKNPASPPLSFSNHTYEWAEYALEPLYDNAFPSADEVTRRIELDNRQVSTNSIVWRVNGLEWNETTNPQPGDVPYLVDIYQRGEAAMPNYTAALANNGWDPATYTFPAKLGEVIEIIWYNTGSLVKNNGGQDFHPFHAHGAHYYDIGCGNGTYDPVANEKKLATYKPVLRDTTNLYRWTEKTVAGERVGWRAWRLRVTDPGVWMIHCHILQHMIMGMQSVWIMGDLDEIKRLPLQDARAYLDFGGGAFGNETYAPVVSHYFEGAEGEEWEEDVENSEI